MYSNITAFVLRLKSADEEEHVIFGLLSLSLLKMMFSSSTQLPAKDKIYSFCG
jgi:hypothetical protein